MRGGDYKGQGEGTNVEANKIKGGWGERPVRHKIPLGILIFLIIEDISKTIH